MLSYFTDNKSEVERLNDLSEVTQKQESSLIYFSLTCSVAQSCPTLSDLMECSPRDSSVHEIILARLLEWVAISYSRGSSQLRY